MRGDDHEQRAKNLEADAQRLEASGGSGAAIVELLWGAAFHTIAYGCQKKLGEHKEKHEGLARFLRDKGEGSVAQEWTTLEQLRQGAFYGHRDDMAVVQSVRALLLSLRDWADN